ncbi:MurR/RpiR family transcriptional regulator [Lampropedia aestuarii]|uniref:MurR/RpiR family transcriptional regulator n=1 Tax=Lampropedia aestuarii TaxID=2562762 RepID=A0A4S5BWY1_9BURK|nr:MurR/RpiR family transcriptional regulator [Lampropedia aestuarii]THJ34538.1 MurR/RpiR family transcriptional regulator [Lampropedia aestuarii]
MHLRELTIAIETAFPSLGLELQRAATWVLNHPREVGLMSMRKQAESAGVTANTMIRLAQSVGFESYIPFRKVFQDGLTHEAPHYTERVKKLQVGMDREFDDELLRTHVSNVQSPTLSNSPDAIAQAVHRMSQARRIFFLGARSCFAISYHFSYAYSMIADNGVLVHGLGGTYPDQLDSAGPEDLLVCITQNPYGRQALEAAKLCSQEGVSVLALTDSKIAPIQAYASQSLLFDAGTPSYFHSMVGSLALVERLLAKLAATGGEPMLRRIEAFEQRLGASSAYLSHPQAKTKPSKKSP